MTVVSTDSDWSYYGCAGNRRRITSPGMKVASFLERQNSPITLIRMTPWCEILIEWFVPVTANILYAFEFGLLFVARQPCTLGGTCTFAIA